jgi:PQQ-dependent catabolism-associated CXXCW motif protein
METADPVALRFEGLTLDPAARTLCDASGGEIALRRSEFDLLLALANRPGWVLSRDQLLDAVAGRRAEPYDRTIDVLVGRLRQKIEPDPKKPHLIVTVPGVGYKFDARPRPVVSRAGASRLSLVVLPFENLGSDPADDHLADAMTDDLTTDLLGRSDIMVAARTSAAAYRGRSVDARRVGEELGVRYLVEGSVRRLDEILHVNVQLISAETGAHLWAGRFEQISRDITTREEEIIGRVRAALRLQLFEAEIARGTRERPRNPDALDLLFRARSATYGPWRTGLLEEKTALLERALRLDPSLAPAMCYLACTLIDRCVIPDHPDFGNENLIAQVAALVSAAAAIDTNNPEFIEASASLLRVQGRLIEAIAEFERLTRLHPNSWAPYRQLGFSKLAAGLPGDAIPLLQKSIRIDPLSPYNRYSCARIGLAFLLLGQEAECIDWEQRALAAGGQGSHAWTAQCHLLKASAHALRGEHSEAHDAVAEANRLWPFATVRTPSRTVVPPRGLPYPIFRAQMERWREGLRLAGLRDHVDEEAEFGIAPEATLQAGSIDLTPATIPGAAKLRTGELAKLIQEQAPVLIDVAADSWGQSLPGAVGLQGVGNGAAFEDSVQVRFRDKIQRLTKRDSARPVVAFCANAERFTGYNLALRLVALGCTQVYWYRGGVEAWQAHGLPVTDLELHPW